MKTYQFMRYFNGYFFHKPYDGLNLNVISIKAVQ